MKNESLDTYLLLFLIYVRRIKGREIDALLLKKQNNKELLDRMCVSSIIKTEKGGVISTP